MSKTPIYWCSPATQCDICSNPFDTTKPIYDIKTKQGPWGLLCSTCMPKLTNGKLGLGLGQKYEYQPDGKWLKTAG